MKWQSPKPRGVLFIDGEMPWDSLKKHMADIITNADQDNTSNLIFITPDLQEFSIPDLATNSGQKLVEKFITNEIDLIIKVFSLVNEGLNQKEIA